jgi:hypothetical protein
LASLVQADDCSDLLTRIQDDAIAKLKMSAERAKLQGSMARKPGGGGGDWPASSDGDVGGARPSGPVGGAPVRAPSTSTPPADVAQDSNEAPSGGGSNVAGPVAASETNKQVQDVDEADFVKVVDSGKGIFLLHGNTLRKLKSWPAAETQLVGSPLTIEGSPSEMFVSEAGKAIVFSSVAYQSGSGGGPSVVADEGVCFDGQCKGYGGSGLKVTIADVSGEQPRVERELYYEGSYVSSRRYSQPGDVVRAIVQANTKFSGLFSPDIEWSDPWGRIYDEDNIASQLAEWERRTTASIRKTTLAEWIPDASEKKDGKLVKIEPACGSYFLPEAGLSDYGLTHVLALDVAHPEQPVGGVTILGASNTVYSNAKQLVLTQPDYRWGSSALDFGIASEQQTALHIFDLAGANTTYRASGFVSGHLPLRNPQFGIDVKEDGTIRLATTGFVRSEPDAPRNDPSFWQQKTANHVLIARVEGKQLTTVGKSAKLGLEGESVYSARFVGNRAYVVTFRQTDPFIVVDVSNPAAPTVLGEAKIPGFSEYMHPLDENHIITVGQSATRGIQLQLFDVTQPTNIPAPKILDFGSGTTSEVSFQHKGFTFFEGVLALPVSGRSYTRSGVYASGLQLVRVDANTGFSLLGSIDHARLYADNGAGVRCGACDALMCSSYVCSYAPEVRRGVFVKGESATYVYSFSHAGVLVNDLANLTQPIAKVGLPAPLLGYDYGSDVKPPFPTSGGMGVPTPVSQPPVQIDPDVARPAVDGGAAMSAPTP